MARNEVKMQWGRGGSNWPGWPVGRLASWPVGQLAGWPVGQVAGWPGWPNFKTKSSA